MRPVVLRQCMHGQRSDDGRQPDDATPLARVIEPRVQPRAVTGQSDVVQVQQKVHSNHNEHANNHGLLAFAERRAARRDGEVSDGRVRVDVAVQELRADEHKVYPQAAPVPRGAGPIRQHVVRAVHKHADEDDGHGELRPADVVNARVVYDGGGYYVLQQAAEDDERPQPHACLVHGEHVGVENVFKDVQLACRQLLERRLHCILQALARTCIAAIAAARLQRPAVAFVHKHDWRASRPHFEVGGRADAVVQVADLDGRFDGRESRRIALALVHGRRDDGVRAAQELYHVGAHLQVGAKRVAPQPAAHLALRRAHLVPRLFADGALGARVVCIHRLAQRVVAKQQVNRAGWRRASVGRGEES